jgi:hypothetical protein
MVARFEVRRRGPWVEAASCAAALLLAAVGCPGNAMLVGEERPPPVPGADDPDGPDGITPAVPPPEVALLSDCPPSPEERQALLGCWPTRHLGSWRGFFIGIPRYETGDGASAEFPPGDVLLELSVDGQAQLVFGAPPLGAPAADPPITLCAPRVGARDCPTPGRLLAGFGYELHELELLDPDPALAPPPRIAGEPPRELAESMRFAVHASEPWDVWCSTLASDRELGCSGGDCSAGEWLPAPGAAIDSPAAGPESQGCSCDASGCRAELPLAPLSIELQMSRDGKALRGSYEPADPSLGEARIELRKAEP